MLLENYAAIVSFLTSRGYTGNAVIPEGAVP
jgi:hypothetical protein